MFQGEPRPTKGDTKFVLHWAIWLILVGAIVVGILGLLNFVFGWAAFPARTLSVDHVREQWQFAYDMEEDLVSMARQVCNYRRALSTAQDDNERAQRQSHLTAAENNYARIASDYNGKMRDAFRAKLVRPLDVRERALPLEEMIQELEREEELKCE